MNKIIFGLLFILSLGLFQNNVQTVNASSYSFESGNAEEKIAKKQEQLINKVERELNKTGLQIDSLSHVSDIYFNEGQIVLHLATPHSENEKYKKIEKLIKK